MLATASSATPTYTAVPYTYAKPANWAADGEKFKPSSGPMSGGQTVTLYARTTAPFQANATVLFNGVPGLTPKVAVGGASMTVVTPVSATGGPVGITVRTPGFSDLKIAAKDSSDVVTGYSYTRAISVSPASGPTDVATPITIRGAGFQSDTYTATDKGLKVYLRDGSANDPVECAELQVVSDSELSCEVPAATTEEKTAGGAAKPFTVVVADDAWADRDDANDSVVSRGAVFIRADF